MSGLCNDEVAPQLFEFIDRTRSGLPDHFLSEAQGVAIACPDLFRGRDDFSNSDSSWIHMFSSPGDGYGRDFPETNIVSLVNQLGDFWYIQRLIVGEHTSDFQELVTAFGNVPICTTTLKDAMRLAEHCHPETHSPLVDWVNID